MSDAASALGTLRLEAADVSAAMQSLFGEDQPAPSLSNSAQGIDIDPDRVEHDLARLVLTLVEFLRRLMEMQAIRRMEAGSLSEDEEEAVGETLMKAHQRVLELAEQFGLEESDLSLDLGPLGKLM